MKYFYYTLFITVIFFTHSKAQVISQIYGGGGNTGAAYDRDFVEILNNTAVAININNYTIQYQTPGLTTWSIIGVLSGTLNAGQYYLIESSLIGGVGSPLPTADVTGTSFNLNATDGKIALYSLNTTITSCADASIIDKVGYGTTNVVCNETQNASRSGINNVRSFLRKKFGCLDTYNNFNDFEVGTVNPRNTATTTVDCNRILPISLLFFKASAEDKYVALTWQTTCEENLSNYQIEKSNDNVTYANVATIAARNTGCSKNEQYLYNDYLNWFNNTTYYRIKTTDNNAVHSYSNIIAVNKDAANSVKPYLVQNPIQNTLQIKNVPIGSHVQVIDFSSKVVINWISQNSIIESKQLPQISSGKYLLSIISSGKSIATLPFIKN